MTGILEVSLYRFIRSSPSTGASLLFPGAVGQLFVFEEEGDPRDPRRPRKPFRRSPFWLLPPSFWLWPLSSLWLVASASAEATPTSSHIIFHIPLWSSRHTTGQVDLPVRPRCLGQRRSSVSVWPGPTNPRTVFRTLVRDVPVFGGRVATRRLCLQSRFCQLSSASRASYPVYPVDQTNNPAAQNRPRRDRRQAWLTGTVWKSSCSCASRRREREHIESTTSCWRGSRSE